MTTKLFSMLPLVAALGAGVVAGVFFAFSSFVMPALARLPPARGIGAMQSINLAVLNRSFLGVFLGTAVCCALLGVRSLLDPSAPGAKLQLVGSASYLVGCLLVTGAFNVPWNDALARLIPDAEPAFAVWSRYLTIWSRWNHVRASASLVAAAAFALSLRERIGDLR